MADLKVIYWSGTGNTEMMADHVAKGAGNAQTYSMEDIKPSDLENDQVFALGAPAMGEEQLEELDVEPFVKKLEKHVSGKTIGMFGSYGWGEGKWMHDWVERMQKAGATVLDGAGIICLDEPDEETCQALEAMGEKLAKLLNA